MKIAVVGLGYVGLPLSIQFVRSCVSVLGIDVDPTKLAKPLDKNRGPPKPAAKPTYASTRIPGVSRSAMFTGTQSTSRGYPGLIV